MWSKACTYMKAQEFYQGRVVPSVGGMACWRRSLHSSAMHFTMQSLVSSVVCVVAGCLFADFGADFLLSTSESSSSYDRLMLRGSSS